MGAPGAGAHLIPATFTNKFVDQLCSSCAGVACLLACYAVACSSLHAPLCGDAAKVKIQRL